MFRDVRGRKGGSKVRGLTIRNYRVSKQVLSVPYPWKLHRTSSEIEDGIHQAASPFPSRQAVLLPLSTSFHSNSSACLNGVVLSCHSVCSCTSFCCLLVLLSPCAAGIMCPARATSVAAPSSRLLAAVYSSCAESPNDRVPWFGLAD